MGATVKFIHAKSSVHTFNHSIERFRGNYTMIDDVRVIACLVEWESISHKLVNLAPKYVEGYLGA